MFATLKETITSVQNKTYGREIIKKPVKSILWYWSKYVLFFASIPLILAVILITYFVPQFPRLVTQYIPDGFIELKDGLLTTSLTPALYSGPDVTFQFDPQNLSPDRADSLPTGFYIFQDALVQAEVNGSYRVQKFSQMPDFHLDKSQAVSWLAGHTSQLWLILILAGLGIWLVVTSFFWSFKVTSFFLWAAGFWAFGRLVKKPLSYLPAFKLAVYAAVPSLIISAILAIAPNQYLSYLNLAVFLFLSLSWLWNLPSPPPPAAK